VKVLRDSNDLLLPQVQHTISQLQLRPEDSATATLAERYAAAIDADPDQLKELGPRLLACLVELGATPRARATTGKGGAAGGTTKLAQLREARAASGR
jgi:hypothetical protein